MSDERACYCDSRQCEICTPDATPRGDLWHATQMLAADNARLCGIVLEADKLVAAVERLKTAQSGEVAAAVAGIQRALDAYKVMKQGH